MYHRIAIIGANGSGKTTLGRHLADMLGYKHMDVEAYSFKASAVPYENPRTREEVQELLSAEIEKYGQFVLSAVNCDFGGHINAMYDCVIYIKAPLDIRLDRIRQRSLHMFGSRVLPGGDMYLQEQHFYDKIASCTMEAADTWLESLNLPVIYIDGTAPAADNAVICFVLLTSPDF